MNEIFRFLVAASAHQVFSDVHIEQDCILKFRFPNGWRDAGFGVVTESKLTSFLQGIDVEWRTKLKRGEPLSLTVDMSEKKLGEGRYRCQVYSIEGCTRISALLRPIPNVPLLLEETGLPAIAMTFANVPKGLFLITGPTGSGKTTTIMALLNKILMQRAVHVVTIEDPIEYILPEGKGIVSQREVGRGLDTESFSVGLKESMRQRPDVIMIGEIRDQETAITALRAAESGHFVVATLHARSAIGAIQKMTQMSGSSAPEIGYTLTGVLAQALVPSLDGTQSVLATELLYALDRDVQNILKEGKWSVLEDLLKRGEKGCYLLNTTLSNLVKANRIKKEDAIAVSYDATDLRKILS